MNLDTKYDLTDRLQQFCNINKLNEDTDEEDKFLKCPQCKIDLDLAKDHSYICSKCSMSVDYSNFGTGCSANSEYQNYNNSNNSFMPMRAQGFGSNKLRTTLLINTSNYKALSNKRNKNKIEQLNYINTDFSFNIDVINLAASWVNEIKQIHRDDVRIGIHASALRYAGIMFNMVKSKEAMAKMFKIPISYVNEGDRLLRKYHTQGIIDIPINKVIIEDQVTQYCKSAKVPDKYIQIVNDVIERIKHKQVAKLKNMFNTTKCIGIIYTLSQVVNDFDITENELSTIGNGITANTYKCVFKIIETNKEDFRKPFKRNSIPYPITWENDVQD
jgi:hypothetical protein